MIQLKGLCHKCFSSNVELTIFKGIPMCQKCRFPDKITIDEERIT